MSTSEFDAYFPQEYAGPRRRRRGGPRGDGRDARDGSGDRSGRGAGDPGGRGSRASDWLTGRGRGRGEQPVVPEPEFTSYYGHSVVKPVPWRHEISIYLFTGGVAGGSGLLAAGAHAAGLPVLRRNARMTAIVAAGVSGVALIADLGRPERFLNMLRTFKITSPMSIGTWIFSGYSTFAGLSAAFEVDRMLGGGSGTGLVDRAGAGLVGRYRKGFGGLPVLGPLLRPFDAVASAGLAFFSAPLAAYTAVLLSDTATPVWFESRRHLPFVFVSSAGMASGGVQQVLAGMLGGESLAEAGPARRLAVAGALGDYLAVDALEKQLDEVGVLEPLHHGAEGRKMRLSKALTVAGGVVTLVAGRSRAGAVVGGLALAAASALTRFAVVEAGIESAKDPRWTVEPQRRRLEARRAAGQTGDSITT
ncbi:NrfD/PsrC family molybdoenzyme membrane anchor subunit [Kytococcus sedentarius]|nr:NrfD/PsrC family molybdoenzyme membrane anchor subunit [Kytococcus sedentarius]QRO87624.1 polysulfide reductase NrfD [Kytococcus sedentarius]